MPYDIFDSYYRKLENDTLTEKMSPEDEHDSALLRDIIDKTSLRTNAKLTPEEKEVLDKYNLYRDDRQVKMSDFPSLSTHDRDLGNEEGGDIDNRGRKAPYSYYRRSPAHHDLDQINYADIARKRPERAKAFLDRIMNDRITQYQEAQREFRNAKWDRDYHQSHIDTADSDYINALQKAKKAYDAAVASAISTRDGVDSYHTPARDKNQKRMDDIYARFKK